MSRICLEIVFKAGVNQWRTQELVLGGGVHKSVVVRVAYLRPKLINLHLYTKKDFSFNICSQKLPRYFQQKHFYLELIFLTAHNFLHR